jgi:two-component system sensor histidine kinase KdpD
VLVRADPDVPAVRGDADYLRHLLRNLVSNALRYSPADTAVEVRIDVIDGEVRLEVFDRGAGFPPGSGEDAFRLFHKSPDAAARLPGAGIGLFVARAVVEAHSGRIWVRNRPDGGSVVGFALPIHDDAAGAPL